MAKSPLTAKLQTYDKVASNALVATIRMLFDLRPSIKVIIAGAIRNADTFESFRQACREFWCLFDKYQVY